MERNSPSPKRQKTTHEKEQRAAGQGIDVDSSGSGGIDASTQQASGDAGNPASVPILASSDSQLKNENYRLKIALAQSSNNAKKWEAELQTLKNNNARLTTALQESTTNVEWQKQLEMYKEEITRLTIKINALERPRRIVYRQVFNDSVHGHIAIHPLLVSIIDTAEFQRLRFIKQMGMCNFVYPGATHTRFEHSVGVSYLAGELARSLQWEQPHLNISEEDVLCVEIAGLCHDLGHGPFSHLFDNLFIPKVKEDCKKEKNNDLEGQFEEETDMEEKPIVGDKVEHEERSVAMFKHLLKKNDLEGRFEEYGLKETDREFIEEQIVGTREEDRKGRTERTFLYDIVANKRNGIDVDKWDYFARDSHHLGISNSFDWRRFIKFARVEVVHGVYQICTRDKEIHNLYEMFHTRYMIHQRACKHKVTHILEEMMAEALKEANDHLRFPGENGLESSQTDWLSSCSSMNIAGVGDEEEGPSLIGKMLRMSQAIDDMEAFSKMTDNVMWAIFASMEEELKKSKDIVKRIMERDLFPYVGETRLTKELIEELTKRPEETPKELTEEEIKERLERRLGGVIHELLDDKAKEVVNKTDIIIRIAKFSYGKKEKDPMDNVKFYKKPKPGWKAEVIDAGQISALDPMALSLPSKFSVKFMRVYIRNTQKEVEQVLGSIREAFEKWRTKVGPRAEPKEESTAKQSGPMEKGNLSPRRPPRKCRRRVVV